MQLIGDGVPHRAALCVRDYLNGALTPHERMQPTDAVGGLGFVGCAVRTKTRGPRGSN